MSLNHLSVCSFFVVEDHILHATQGLVTRAFTDELWNMALSKIIAVLRTHSVSSECTFSHTHTYTHTIHLDLLYLMHKEKRIYFRPPHSSSCYLHSLVQVPLSCFVIESYLAAGVGWLDLFVRAAGHRL